MSNQTTQEEKKQINISDLSLALTTSSAFFKPEDGKTYVIRISPTDPVEMIKNPRFADKNGYIPTRFEFTITHANNGAQQKWTVSKTVAKQLADILGADKTVMEITRQGTDRSTVYSIKAVQ